MTATSLLFLDHRAVERRKSCKTSRFPRDVARFFVSLSSAEGEPGRLAGDRRVYHGSAFLGRLLMRFVKKCAPCLRGGRFGGMLTAAAVRSVRRAKKERAHKGEVS